MSSRPKSGKEENMSQVLADMVAEYKVTWQKNLTALKARGEDPQESRSLLESFAHYTTAQRMLIAYLDQVAPMDKGIWATRTEGNSRACREADRLVEQSYAWKAYQESLNK
jgi:hypothetical protein